jgi:hypothetical protein
VTPSDRNRNYITIYGYHPDSWDRFGRRGLFDTGDDFPVIEYTYKRGDVIRLVYDEPRAWHRGEGWPCAMYINDGPRIPLAHNHERLRHELYTPPTGERKDTDDGATE